MQVGDIVKIKPPFSDFLKEHTIVKANELDDGEIVYFIDEFEGGFSDIYLEKV